MRRPELGRKTSGGAGVRWEEEGDAHEHEEALGISPGCLLEAEEGRRVLATRAGGGVKASPWAAT